MAIAATPSGDGYWTLDQRGNVLSFGDARDFAAGPEPSAGRPERFVAMAATPSGDGLWLLTESGDVLSFGDAATLASREG